MTCALIFAVRPSIRPSGRPEKEPSCGGTSRRANVTTTNFVMVSQNSYHSRQLVSVQGVMMFSFGEARNARARSLA
jgi:hypothetical protein